ncbi:hypothetical protein ACSHT2_05420 [Bradyrhizobium sp. PUT101]|uniref:hypothetical protein n=1 Tax=Bradyrhizobium sp. PUT101 TaxID=3447427 RepID=UPI003F879D47
MFKINTLFSFDAILDCVASDNRLKVRRRKSALGEFGFTPELALTIRIRTISMGREAMGCSRQEGVL